MHMDVSVDSSMINWHKEVEMDQALHKSSQSLKKRQTQILLKVQVVRMMMKHDSC